MNNTRLLWQIAGLMLIVLLFAGCGGARAELTATSAPPTATSAPTSPPASATPVPPTATAASVPTIAPTEATGNKEYLKIFETVWNTVDQTYFDPDFGGLDWDAVHDDYEPLIAAAEDDETLYQLLNQMLWELNVSHAGVGPAEMWPSVEPMIFIEGEIGIDVRLLDDQVVITQLEDGSPAEKADLRPGFIIQRIEGTSVEQIIADAQEHLAPPYNDQGRKNIMTRSLLSLIYGDPGTCVTLAYLDEMDKFHEGCIERIQRPRAAYMTGISLPPFYLEFESLRLESGIGYIRLNTFHPDLIPDLVEAVAALQDAPGIIIDLRGNPGGNPDTAEQMAAQFLDGQVLFGSFRIRPGTMPRLVTGKNVYTGPVVILIDVLSYSASEWFASGMQAVGRAVIIGERSPGGESGMDIKTLSNGAILGYPTLLMLAPDGTVLEGYGVIPDITVTLERSQLLEGIDAQLEAGINYILETTQE
jgi:carboxyl-terminal processing protease